MFRSKPDGYRHELLDPESCGSSGEFVGDIRRTELHSGSTEGGRPSHLRLRITRFARAIRRRRRKGLTESVGEMTINEYM